MASTIGLPLEGTDSDGTSHSVQAGVFADRRLRHRTTFGLRPDDFVTIVDKHVEVLQEVLAVYTSHVADDGCQMTGADQI